jgi:hypothetical protein
MSISVDRILTQRATHGGARISLEIGSGQGTETIDCNYETAPRLIQAIQQAALAAAVLRKSQPGQRFEIVHPHKAIDARTGRSLDGQTIGIRFSTDGGAPLEVALNRKLAQQMIESLTAELRKPLRAQQRLS